MEREVFQDAYLEWPAYEPISTPLECLPANLAKKLETPPKPPLPFMGPQVASKS